MLLTLDDGDFPCVQQSPRFPSRSGTDYCHSFPILD